MLHFFNETDIVRIVDDKRIRGDMSSKAIEITLMGRTYSIACPEGQETALRQVSQHLEMQLSTLKAKTNSLSREEIAIMAALNIGYELLEEQRKSQAYNQQVDEKIALLQSTIEDALVERAVKAESPMHVESANEDKLIVPEVYRNIKRD